MNLIRGIVGIVALLAICYAFSNNRRAIDWKLVGVGVFAQIMFALGILNPLPFWVVLAVIFVYITVRKEIAKTASLRSRLISAGVLLVSVGVILGWIPKNSFKMIIESASNVFVSMINLSHQGTEFIFGNLADFKQNWGYVFAIQVLPNIIFFAAASSLLYYLGVLQVIVKFFSWLLSKIMNLSGAESLSTAANIFLGQTEAPLMVRPYLAGMSKSEILCVMVGGMANTAGSVLAAYVGMLGGSDPAQQQFFALHLLSQSIMSAPAAIVCSKILFPQTEKVEAYVPIPKENIGDNALDAISNGTTDGLKLAANVAAMLVVFTALMAVANAMLGWFGGINHIFGRSFTSLNDLIAQGTNGQYTEFSFKMVFGYVFAPLAWLIGTHPKDILNVGQLLGEKTIINEFYAYGSLAKMRAAGIVFDPKSLLIVTYALSGFANFASIGIQIGGISQLAPTQRRNLTELGIKALIGGTVACLMCACVAGMLY